MNQSTPRIIGHLSPKTPFSGPAEVVAEFRHLLQERVFYCEQSVGWMIVTMCPVEHEGRLHLLMSDLTDRLVLVPAKDIGLFRPTGKDAWRIYLGIGDAQYHERRVLMAHEGDIDPLAYELLGSDLVKTLSGYDLTTYDDVQELRELGVVQDLPLTYMWDQEIGDLRLRGDYDHEISEALRATFLAEDIAP